MVEHDHRPARHYPTLHRRHEPLHIPVQQECQKQQRRIERVDIQAQPFDDEMIEEPDCQNRAQRQRYQRIPLQPLREG